MLSLVALKEMCIQVRRDIVRMVHGVQSGHPGGSLGCVELFVVLYFHILKHQAQPFQIDGRGEDIFFLSNGHISPVFYSVLARAGYFSVDELSTFRKINSRLQGHPTSHTHLPGVRVASGSLGQGLSVSIGAALSKKYNQDKQCVFCLLGDGECQEGQIWEACMFAAHHKVDNLIAIIDYNGQQIDGPTNDILSLGDMKQKLLAFNWHVMEMNGNDIEAVMEVLKQAQQATYKGKPIMIIMKTIMGKGVDFMENSHKWHGVAPNNEQLQLALQQLPSTLKDY